MKRIHCFLMAGVLGLFLASCSEDDGVRPVDAMGQRYNGTFQTSSGKADVAGSVVVIKQGNTDADTLVVDFVLNIEGEADTLKNVVVYAGQEGSGSLSLTLADLSDNDDDGLNLILNIGLSILLGLGDQDIIAITGFSGNVQGENMNLDVVTDAGVQLQFTGKED